MSIAIAKLHILLSLIVTFVFLCTNLALGQPGAALVWQPSIPDAALPSKVVTVDKSKQQFYLYQKNTPFALTHNYACTTGQIDGDKQISNDKRTPEGVYFVVYKIDKGLDFKEYGGIAYTLNYPNPVDKLRGKTGYGIWIHSKGDGIKPKITRGCIAIGLDEIATVGPLLTSGTPVVVGETLNPVVPMTDDGTAMHLRRRMEQWTHAWASRSQTFFDFYDAESYTKAMPETFHAFRLNKERLFKRLDWINIFNREVHVLEGPGYWVTWSEQFYRAPNLSTEGIRRLYWQRDADNQFRIVGMEWIPSNLGLQAAFKQGKLVATNSEQKSDATPPSIRSEKPQVPPLDMPENDVPPLAQEIKEDKIQQPTNSTLPLAVNPQQKVAPAAKTTIILDDNLKAIMLQNIKDWNMAWATQESKAFFNFYDTERYGKEVGQNYRNAYRQLQKIMSPYFKKPWLQMLSTEADLKVQNDILIASLRQWIFVSGSKPKEGEHTLYWKKNAIGQWRIVASDWKDMPVTLQVDYLEKVSSEIGNMIEIWRKDWLSGDVDKYIRHYSPKARQAGRNRNGIALQKKRVWARAAPAKVELSGMRLQITAKGIVADMLQSYEDSNGKGDKGTKTLLLTPTKNGWQIEREEWIKAK